MEVTPSFGRSTCWHIAIVQQYAPLKESRIRAAVFGHSRPFFLMRQNDHADLSDGIKPTILNDPFPDQQPAENFAAFPSASSAVASGYLEPVAE